MGLKMIGMAAALLLAGCGSGTSAPTQAELKTICVKMQNVATGQPEDTISVEVISPTMATLSYVRDDGKPFKYDCRVTGDRVDHRMREEAGPGTSGEWGQNLWHTWSREGGHIVVVEHVAPG